MKKVAFYECYYDEKSDKFFDLDMKTELKTKGKAKPVVIVKDFNNEMSIMTKKTLLSLVGKPDIGFVNIDGFMDCYIIDKNGNLFSKKAKRFIKPVKDKQAKNKYRLRFDLYDKDGNRKSAFTHRLLAKAFIPNPKDKPEVNHKDGDPSNNDLSNLEWVTKAENVAHAQANYLYGSSQKEVNVFDKEYNFINSYQSMQEAADKLGMISKNANKNISEVCTKNANPDIINKRHPFGKFMSEGYIFEYK
jgi:hypothetical protein